MSKSNEGKRLLKLSLVDEEERCNKDNIDVKSSDQQCKGGICFE